jgi:hypothetical protein
MELTHALLSDISRVDFDQCSVTVALGCPWHESGARVGECKIRTVGVRSDLVERFRSVGGTPCDTSLDGLELFAYRIDLWT